MLNLKKFSTKRSSKRSAFTLIELSIVLIIIGLLVAGVTGGASLIKSAKLRSLMSEVIGYNVAVNSFNAIYDRMPGDYGTAIGNSEAGNQNGRIEFVNGDGITPDEAEGVNAWIQLINSGTIDEILTGYAANDHDVVAAATFDAGVIGTDYPRSKFDGVGYLFDFVGTRNVLVATATPTALTAHTIGTAQVINTTEIFTPVDSLSIDTKLDDANASGGTVRASAGVTTIANCHDAGVYDTVQTAVQCALEFTVDIS